MKTKKKKHPLKNRITFRVSDETLSLLNRSAEESGLVDVSDVIRMAIHSAMVKEPSQKYIEKYKN